MIKKLLLAYDGSPAADAAISDLIHAALPAQLEATVISVADVYLPAQASSPASAEQSTVSAVARKAYEKAVGAVAAQHSQAVRACARLQALFPKWTCSAVSAGDSPAWAILSKAGEWKADLIVVGSHSHSRLEHFFLGSVSHKVAAEAACSVRVSRPRLGKDELRILIALDGSEDSRTALRRLAARPWPKGTHFRLATVVDSHLATTVAPPGFFPEHFSESQPREGLDWISRMTEAAAQILFTAGLEVTNYIYEGDPKEILVHESAEWKADTIFLGARGLHHGGRLTLGTVASAVATRARCSVELVRTAIQTP